MQKKARLPKRSKVSMVPREEQAGQCGVAEPMKDM